VSGFLTEEECNRIQEAALPRLAQSTVKDTKSTSGANTFLKASECAALFSINDRIANLTRTNLNQQETLQVLNYEKGQKHDSHWDYIDPERYEGTAQEKVMLGGKNRMLTVLWYLTSVSDGGETVFPMANGSPKPPSNKLANRKDCDQQGGIKINAIKGRVVLLYSMLPDGTLDPNSLHGACPVEHENEEKWEAKKWIWNKSSGSVI